MTERIDPATLAAMKPAELARLLYALRQELDGLAAEGGAPDPDMEANLTAAGAELALRRQSALTEELQPSELHELPNSVAPRGGIH